MATPPSIAGAAVPDSPDIRRVAACGALLLIVAVYKFSGLGDAFPAAFQFPVREPVDAFADWIPETFNFILYPVSQGVKAALSAIDDVFLSIPWFILVLGLFLVAFWLSGPGLAVFCAASLMFMGLIGLWEVSVVTITIMTFSVVVTVTIGIPIGILAARDDRFDVLLRPVLDAMQTMPIFVYLIPVMLLFGIGATSAVLATVIYSMPPVIRLTNLGIRQVPAEAIEVARSYGSMPRQILYKVQIPLARPTIMMGVNQTVMMALGMVIFVALIGASGLGKEIWLAMRRLRIGDALEGGLAVVLLAIVLDRLGDALSRRRNDAKAAPKYRRYGLFGAFDRAMGPVLSAGTALAGAVVGGLGGAARLGPGAFALRARLFLDRHRFGATSAAVLLGVLLIDLALFETSGFPREWKLNFTKPIDDAVDWLNINLAFITDPLRAAIFVYGLNPIRTLLLWIPWPALILGATFLAWTVAGWRIALLAFLGFGFIAVVGMWQPMLTSLSQVAIATILSVAIAVPLGVCASRYGWLDVALRPVLDTMQTLPAFVYFPVIIMLFKVGELSGIIATVIYAIPPAVRLTNLGLRQVPVEALEAARSCGSTPVQTLFKVELPMALPSIMMGINQTTMMALAMITYAALIGTPGLGFEVLLAIGQFDVGRGFEAGMSIVIVAVVADRISQASAHKRRKSLGLDTAA